MPIVCINCGKRTTYDKERAIAYLGGLFKALACEMLPSHPTIENLLHRRPQGRQNRLHQTIDKKEGSCPSRGQHLSLNKKKTEKKRKRRGRKNAWHLDPDVVKLWVYTIAFAYPYKLTLRSIFYRLVAVYGFPNILGAYKWLSRWTVRWRKDDRWLRDKFADYGRLPVIHPEPSIPEVEMWLEKSSTYALIQDILKRFKVGVQISKGYGSRTMFWNALRRAERQGIKRVGYLGDFDPSGLDILRVTRKRLAPLGLEFKKIALTRTQIKRYKLPHRLAKSRDRRTPKYVQRFGNQTWELESLDPKVLRRIVERELRKLIPPERLREVEVAERAVGIAVEFLKPTREAIERVVRRLLERGVSREEIMRRLKRKKW